MIAALSDSVMLVKYFSITIWGCAVVGDNILPSVGFDFWFGDFTHRQISVGGLKP